MPVESEASSVGLRIPSRTTVSVLLLGLLGVVAVQGRGHAISPHRLDLEEVLRQPCRVVEAVLSHRRESATEHAALEEYRFVVARSLWGTGPKGTRTGTYAEAYPWHAPDGKVHCPIWSGSGIEHELVPKQSYLFVLDWDASASSERVRRVEPLGMRDEILRILRAQPRPSLHRS